MGTASVARGSGGCTPVPPSSFGGAREGLCSLQCRITVTCESAISMHLLQTSRPAPSVLLISTVSSLNSTFLSGKRKLIAVIGSEAPWALSCVYKVLSWLRMTLPFPPCCPKCRDKPGMFVLPHAVSQQESPVLPRHSPTENQFFVLLSKRIFANNFLKRQLKNGPVVTHICTQARE